MRVIIANRSVFPFHPPGGLEKYIFYFSRALRQEGVEVEVVASVPPGGERRVQLDGVSYTFLPPAVSWERPFAVGPSLGGFFLSLTLARSLRGRRFDILPAYNTLPSVSVRLPGRAAVVCQPFEEVLNFGLGGEERLSLAQRVAVSAKRHMDRYILTHADAVAYDPEVLGDAFVRFFDVRRDRLFNLPVGVDIVTVDAALKGYRLSREEVGLGEGDFVLISVNRLLPIKGLNYLVDAFAKIAQKIPSARLVLVGAGPEEGALYKQTEELGLWGKVLHWRNVPDERLYRLYALADLYVSPTLHIGTTQSIIEAMACGLPVVSTGDQGYWVREGINGYVVPKRDPEALAQAVIKVFHQQRGQPLREASRSIALQYDFRNIARKAIAEYERILSGKRSVHNATWARMHHRPGARGPDTGMRKRISLTTVGRSLSISEASTSRWGGRGPSRRACGSCGSTSAQVMPFDSSGGASGGPPTCAWSRSGGWPTCSSATSPTS